ncbi:MAG TPA: enolase C-terminal domain-like protein [Kofleriaceae bacterium]|nr:enolase C-terminal domain-like protein [Kofleriaceae bacterium]
MRIAAIAAQTLRWPIAGTGAARGRSERAAVILEVRSERGAIGLGEAAPLPGMSLDTLEQAEQALAAFARLAPFELAVLELAGIDRDSHVEAAIGAGHAHVGAVNISDACLAPEARMPFAIVDPSAAHAFAIAPPAARFAIETALCDAIARERGVSLAALLRASAARPATRPPAEAAPVPPGRGGSSTTPSSPLHPTVGPHAASTIPRNRPPIAYGGAARMVPLSVVVDDPAAARRAHAAGIRSFKIKLASDDPLDRAFAIAAAAPGARLRIDANRSWPRDEVAGRLAALAALPIDYVEEPCRDAHLLLATALPCKLALDESLAELTPAELAAALSSPQLAAVILKPTVLGGLAASLALAALARRSGVAAVASHALEGPIGTAACAELALALAARDAAAAVPAAAAGLAPHAALDGWQLGVDQLAADHVRAAAAPGLGFFDLDLAGVVHACGSRIAGAPRPGDRSAP